MLFHQTPLFCMSMRLCGCTYATTECLHKALLSYNSKSIRLEFGKTNLQYIHHFCIQTPDKHVVKPSTISSLLWPTQCHSPIQTLVANDINIIRSNSISSLGNTHSLLCMIADSVPPVNYNMAEVVLQFCGEKI